MARRRGGSVNSNLERYNGNQGRNSGEYDPSISFGGYEFYNGPVIEDYMQPIGDTGFFVTPNEPADPTDCARYPDSPWCGGTGLNIDPLDLSPIGLEPAFEISPCEVCIRVDGRFFWIALPPQHICYRRKDPECQPPPPEPPIPEPPPLPEPPPSPPTFTPTPPGGPPPGCPCPGVSYFVWQRTTTFDGQVREIGFFTAATFGPPLGFYWTQDFNIAPPGMNPERAPYAYAMVSLGRDGKAIVSDWESAAATVQPVYERWIKSDPNCDCSVGAAPPAAPPPMPPPTPPGGCCRSMCCNNSESKEQTELLRLIARRLGTQNYPVRTPRWLTAHGDEGTATHQSLTELHAWLARQIDALMGEFPIKVEIEDSDPTAEGQQKKSVTLPNLAESVAEIYGLVAKTSIDSDVHTSFLMRLAAEVMAAKTAALVAQDYASANASYLGYKGNEVKRRVSFAFDPNRQDSLETVLNESTQTIIGWANDDRENVADYLQKLMFSAGLVKSVFFRKGSDLKRIVDELRSFMPTARDEGEEDNSAWRQFINELNNPESIFNKDAFVKPEINNIPTPRDGEGR